jgi:hypothetical protein
VIDSTGLKVVGAGDWLHEKHGGKPRRTWRKLHLAVGPLLDQIPHAISAVTADGAYDGNPVYQAVAERAPDAAVIIPPRATAVLSDTAETAPTQRDRHIQTIAEKGRLGWQKAVGYGKGSLVEVAMLATRP